MTPLFGFVVLALHTPWVVPPPGATWIAACAAAPTRAPHPLALAKKKNEGWVTEQTEEGEAEEYAREAAASNKDEDEQGRTSAGRIVDGMETSLGREDELKPYPGPPVPEEPEAKVDLRPVFAHMRLFVAGQQPGEALQEAYTEWLAGSGDICLPHYLLAQESFEDAWEHGEVLTDDDVARLDAADEEQARAAAEAASEGEAAGEAVAGEAAATATATATAYTMDAMNMPFVLGHLNIARAEDWDAAAAWSSADPILAASGYENAAMHHWMVSDDEALRRRAAGEMQQPYAVYCRDREGATELRGKTRAAHLDWLRESGRVCLGGPLVEQDGANDLAEAPRVGTLLIVNGDTLDEVREWAAADPYHAAGLFESVLVAPLASYSVPEDPLPL